MLEKTVDDDFHQLSLAIWWCVRPLQQSCYQDCPSAREGVAYIVYPMMLALLDVIMDGGRDALDGLRRTYVSDPRTKLLPLL